jgi:mRNA interferase MazF
MKYKIVLVPFPFDDLSTLKVRPALCLTNTISGYNHIVIAFITSRISKVNEDSDLKLLSSDPDFALTGLRVDSAVRLHRLVTIPKKLVLRELGELPNNYVVEIKEKLKKLFEI